MAEYLQTQETTTVQVSSADVVFAWVDLQDDLDFSLILCDCLLIREICENKYPTMFLDLKSVP